MNALLKFLEIRIAIFGLLVFSEVLNLASYGAGPFERIGSLSRYGMYAVTLFLIILRFKSVVRPAMRDPFVWALVGMAIVSFIWSDLPYVSRKSGILLLQTTLFGLYLASRYSLKEQLRIVAWALGIAAVFSLLYTLAFPGYGIEEGLWRGPLIQKNLLARLMVISALPILLVALNSRRYRYILWPVFGLTVALIALTSSKSALLVFLTLILLLPFYRALQWSHSIVVPIVIVIILILGSAATWLITNWEPFLYSLGKDPTLTGRTEIWDAVIDKIWERPWLGYGYQAFWQEGAEGFMAVYKVFFIKITQAHNGFLDITADLGLVGLLFFMLSLLTAYLRALNWVRLGKTVESLWPIIYITFLFMYNQTESTNIQLNSVFWILYVAVTFSLNWGQAVKARTFYEEPEKEELVKQF